MKFRKTKFTLWLIASLGSFLLSGCGGPEVTLGFPLSNGNSWNYQGTITYKVANQASSMPPLSFKLICHQFAGKANLPMELTMLEEGEPQWSVQLVQNPNGISNPLTGELWLPRHLRTGKKWRVTIEGVSTLFILHNQTSSTVPGGTFPTYLIDFVRSKEGKGSLWLDPDVGIIMLNWISKTQGGESALHLDLVSYTLPGEASQTP